MQHTNYCFSCQLWRMNFKTCVLKQVTFLICNHLLLFEKASIQEKRKHVFWCRLQMQHTNYCFSCQLWRMNFKTCVLKQVTFLICNHLLLFEKASIQEKRKHFKCNTQIIVFLANYEEWISKHVFWSRLLF